MGWGWQDTKDALPLCPWCQVITIVQMINKAWDLWQTHHSVTSYCIMDRNRTKSGPLLYASISHKLTSNAKWPLLGELRSLGQKVLFNYMHSELFPSLYFFVILLCVKFLAEHTLAIAGMIFCSNALFLSLLHRYFGAAEGRLEHF